MRNPDGHRLPSWVEDVYDKLAPEILEREEGIARDDAETFLTDREDVDLTQIDVEYAVDQLLDRGYLYEVGDRLFVTEPPHWIIRP